jgi:hypothetical protein
MKSMGFFLKISLFSLFLTFFLSSFSLAQKTCDTTYHIDHNGPVVSIDGYYRLLSNGEKHFRTIIFDKYGGYEDTGWYYGYAYTVLYISGTWTSVQTKLDGSTMQIVIKRPLRTYYDRALIEWKLNESKASFCEWGDAAAKKCYPTPNMGYGHTVTVKISTSNCSTPTCTGTTPSNANLCSGDSSGLTSNVVKSLVSSCTASKKCEYTCKSGYKKVGSSCVACTCGNTEAYCDGAKYSDSCGVANACEGTKTCTPAERCVGMTYTCSASGVYQTRGSYEQVVCSSGACPFTAYSWLDYSMCGDDDPCRVETCGDSCEYNYCSDDTTIKRRTVGTDYDCYPGVSGGCLNEESTSCPPETTPETCEVGYVCKEVPGIQSCRSMPEVDCVPKSSSWSEV